MGTFKVIIFFIIFMISIVGCSDGNSDSAPSASTPPPVEEVKIGLPIVVLPRTTEELTLNQQTVIIDMKIVDSQIASPYSKGGVTILFPKDQVLQGRDIGSFVSSTVEVENGSARFVYTGPSQLSDNTADIVFFFYHEENPSSLSQFTLSVNPNPSQITLKEYKIESNIGLIDATISLETTANLSFFITEDNDANTLLDDNQINYLKVTTLNPVFAQLSSTQAETNTTSFSISSDNNSFSIIVKSFKLSGIVPLKVDASFTDVNGKIRILSKVFNILIISGPPNAVSINYDSTVESPDAGFVEYWTLRVTDKYNNLINTNPSISMGLVVGYTKDSSGSSGLGGTYPYLYFDTSSSNTGTLSKVNNTFVSEGAVFGNVNLGIDSLVVFAPNLINKSEYTYNVSGKWDVSAVSEDNTTLTLTDLYDGNDTTSLGFAVGRNYRQIPTDEGREAIANVYPVDHNYTIGDNGTMRLEIAGDSYLVGKTLMLWTNFVGQQVFPEEIVRIGEGRKITIRNFGLKADPVSVSRGVVSYMKRIPIFAEGTGERYHNGNFLYDVKISDNLILDKNVSSTISDYEAFVDVTVTDVDGNSSGTIEITNLRIVDEF